MEEQSPEKQQVDVRLTFEADTKMDKDEIEVLVRSAVAAIVESGPIELLGLKVREEAQIYGNEPPMGEVVGALGQALDWISELIADEVEGYLEQNRPRWKEIQQVYAKNDQPK